MRDRHFDQNEPAGSADPNPAPAGEQFAFAKLGAGGIQFPGRSPASPQGPNDELPPAVEEAILALPDALGQTLWRARTRAWNDFAAQFDARPERVRAWIGLSRVIRRAVGDLCWLSPNFAGALDPGVSIQIGELSRRGAAERPEPEPGEGSESQIQRRGQAMDFPTLDSACAWLARMIAQLPTATPALKSPINPTPLAIPDARNTLVPLWDAHPRIKPLREIADLFAALPEGVTPILFGSLAADRAWLEYNDFDLALLLPDPARVDSRMLIRTIRIARALAPLVTAIDPLQHHGPFVLLESDFDRWLPSYLPLDTFTKSTILRGASTAPISHPAVILKDRVFALDALLTAHVGARRLAANPRHLTDRYVAKFATSLGLLVPALWCGALGRPTEKGASFEIFRAEMKPNARRAIETLERFRREWDFTLFPPRPILNLAGDRAHAIARNVNRLPSARLARLMEAIHPLIDECFTLALESLADRLPE